MSETSAPKTFDENEQHDWCLWVIEHGLPQLPDEVERVWTVPVASYSYFDLKSRCSHGP